MLVRVEPPVIGQNYGLGSEDISHLILTAKYEGVSLFPIKEWPCHVYVSRILSDSVISALKFTASQIEVIAWGIIFRNFDEAREHAKQFKCII